jgi:hypothetical protein
MQQPTLACVFLSAHTWLLCVPQLGLPHSQLINRDLSPGQRSPFGLKRRRFFIQSGVCFESLELNAFFPLKRRVTLGLQILWQMPRLSLFFFFLKQTFSILLPDICEKILFKKPKLYILSVLRL